MYSCKVYCIWSINMEEYRIRFCFVNRKSMVEVHLYIHVFTTNWIFRAWLFTSLITDLCQDINRVFSFSHEGIALLRPMPQMRRITNTNLLFWVNLSRPWWSTSFTKMFHLGTWIPLFMYGQKSTFYELNDWTLFL